jgi:hypothetical protein
MNNILYFQEKEEILNKLEEVIKYNIEGMQKRKKELKKTKVKLLELIEIKDMQIRKDIII